jgi:type IV secretion system protein VirB6
MAFCPALQTGDAFLSSLLNHIDCQGRAIGRLGYQSLADPTSPLTLVVTSLLTLFVALLGLRMMLGQAPSPRELVMAIVKIGVVLTLAGTWPAYQTLVYDVVVDGPAQLARLVGGPAGLPGSSGDLVTRLQDADNAMVRLTSLGTGREDGAALATLSAGGVPQRFPISDNPAFGWARVFFLAATTAAFALVRLGAGVLLALAPLFAGLILFSVGRGLAVGWARSLAFTFLASVGVSITLGVQLALIEPWLAQAIELRQAQTTTPSAPVEMLVLSLTFAAALIGLLALSARVSFMTAAPTDGWLSVLSAPSRPSREMAIGPAAPAQPPRLAALPVSHAPANRALAVADAVQAAQRRERASQAQSAAMIGQSGRVVGSPALISDDLAIPAYGQGLRRAKPRKSLSAALRDKRS